MTLISHRNEFIFIHIYKTAGTAVTDNLIKYASLKDRIAYDYFVTTKLANIADRIFNSWDDGRKWLTGYHKHARAIILREYLGTERFNQYYKFAIVRNSWDWLASLYFYIKREKTHVDHTLANKLTFNKFLKYYLKTDPLLQLDFLTDYKGNIIVDKIGRFENLEPDLALILRELNIEQKNNGQSRLEVKNMSMNRVRDYQIYFDRESIDLVADYFKRDIEYFQFSYD